MKKQKVNYELKKIDNTIVLTIGSLENHTYAKFYFILSESKNIEFELTQDIYNAMLEYESEREKIIVGKREFIKYLFEIMSKEGD